MAKKLFIISQTTNYKGGGEKTGTHKVQMDESEINSYVATLDGKIDVYEQNLTLSVDASTATSSNSLVDFVKITHPVLKTQFISNSNKRPLVLKVSTDAFIEVLKGLKPFDAPYSADFPKDVSVDSGKVYMM